VERNILWAVGVAISIAIAAVWAAQRSGLWRVWRRNSEGLAELRRRCDTASDAAEHKAYDALLQWNQNLRARWALQEADLELTERTRELLQHIAAAFHPKAEHPLLQARLGRLPQALLEIKKQMFAWTESPSPQVRRVLRLRLRHALLFVRAWRAKREWEHTTVHRYRLLRALEWVYTLYRVADLTFWVLKAATEFFRLAVFKEFLLQWYLTVGLQAVQVYGDREAEPEIEGEEILAHLEPVAEPEMQEDGLPAQLAERVRASRNDILLAVRWIAWNKVKDNYRRLVREIAGFYHPDSPEPLYEMELRQLLIAGGRLAEGLADLEKKPVARALLRLRLAHIFLFKDAMDFLSDHWLVEQLRKYRLHQVARYVPTLFQVFVKRHPGILFKDFAFTLATEAFKRWAFVYVHDTLAREAHLVYRSPSSL
jgi:hypothetical protein